MEKTLRYKTSRISFIHNYILVLLLIVFLFFLFLSVHLENLPWLIVLYITFLVILVLIIEPEFSRVYRYYLVEENQMSMIEGIFVRKKLSIPYEKITDTSVSKTFFGRILNYGDITVSGIRNDITMRGVRDPYKIYHEIQGRIAASRKTKPTKKT